MKTLLTLFLAILITVPALANDRKSWIVKSVMENGDNIQPISPVFYFADFSGGENYPGAISGSDNFWDYQTNGSSLTSIVVLGDTIVIAYPGVDSTDPTGLTTRLAYYIVSDNGGSTWSAPIPLSALPNRSGYPDISTYISAVGRTVTITGRKYNSSGSRGGAFSDALLGLGSITGANVPFDGRDYFGHYQNGEFVAGIYSNPTGPTPASDPDSLLFVRYNYNTNTFGTRIPLALPRDGSINLNVRYRHTASFNGQTQFAMWWCPDPRTSATPPVDSFDVMSGKVSTNGGDSWGPTITLHKTMGQNGVINGDTCGPWFGMDAVFKPNTQEYSCVWSTLYPSIPTRGGLNSANRQGCKVLYWNPAVNGGTPVEVAGRNMPQYANDTLFLNRASLQVGVTPVSHPSIAYSQDGNMIVVAFSAFQPGDTVVNTNPAAVENFTNNDIWTTYSTNNGLTWATPENRTQTPGWDELYPILSETGNSSSKFHLKFQSTRLPGSQSFTDVVNTSRVYTVYRTFNPTTGIEINPVGTLIPSQFDLKQNFPNPFNPSTTIRFDLSKNSNVTLKVYNVLGKEVATLLSNELVTAGTKEIKFDAAALSSGIYFYTLTAGNFTSTKKMMLMK